MKSSCRNEKTFPFSDMTFTVVWRRKKISKIQKPIFENLRNFRGFFFFFFLHSCFDRILSYLFKLCKHKERENPQEWTLEGIENISFVNLSLSDDTFDTFSSSSYFFFLFLHQFTSSWDTCSKPQNICNFFFLLFICFLWYVFCVALVDRSLESGCKTMFYDALKYVYSKHNANYELRLMRLFTVFSPASYAF